MRLIVLATGKCILELPPETPREVMEAIGERFKRWVESRDDVLIVPGIVELALEVEPTGELELREAG